MVSHSSLFTLTLTAFIFARPLLDSFRMFSHCTVTKLVKLSKVRGSKLTRAWKIVDGRWVGAQIHLILTNLSPIDHRSISFRLKLSYFTILLLLQWMEKECRHPLAAARPEEFINVLLWENTNNESSWSKLRMSNVFFI